jgi:hypothetical protein
MKVIRVALNDLLNKIIFIEVVSDVNKEWVLIVTSFSKYRKVKVAMFKCGACNFDSKNRWQIQRQCHIYVYIFFK